MRRCRALVGLALAALVATTGAPAAALTGPGPTQPVRTRSYPDPFVLRVGSTYFAYATDGDLGEVQVISSTDLVTWQTAGDGEALDGADAPSWAQEDDVWAPAVVQLSATSYVLYASFVHTSTGKRCIGTATASDPAGPFVGTGDPIVCDDARGGVIDPSVHTSGSTRYLLWKTEGVSESEPPKVFSRPLGSNGLSLTGTAAEVFRSEQPWEGTLVENPAMVTDGGRTYLFYSGNEWESADYKIGWAACAGPQGPCIAPPDRPFMTSEPNIYGPGGGAVFADDEGWWMAFAAWTSASQTTEDTGQRALFLRRLRFAGGRPQITNSAGAYTEPAFTQRVAGTDRYKTSAAFASKTVQAQRPLTYVATATTYTDALIGAAAAGHEESPVLLVTRDGIDPEVRAQLARISPGHIVVMGGPATISEAVVDDLRQYTDGLHREEGVNQYHQAALVSRNTYDPGVGVAYVTTGQNFPDALAGAGAAAANDGPLLLVERDSIPVDPRTELDRLNPQRIVVLGGTAAVSETVLNALREYSANVTRVAGVDRYETAALIAETQFTKVNGSVAAVVIATGRNFPDAVTAGAAGYPVLLVPGTSGHARAKSALEGLNPLAVVVSGGTGAVADQALRDLGLTP